MKVTPILMAGLAVWLLFELKDFINNGGFSYPLAFGLLKIFLIILSIISVSFFNFFMNLMPSIIRRSLHLDALHCNRQKYEKRKETDATLPELSLRRIFRKNSISY